MPPRPASPKPKAKKDTTARAEGDGTTRAKPAKAPKAAPSSRKAAGAENMDNGQDPSDPPREPDRVRVFLKISAETGTSVSSCVACDQKSNQAWALDFDGQRAGAAVGLDAVFSADTPEPHMYPEVVQSLVNDFIVSKRGVATLMTYGQSEAGKESVMYGEAGSRVNLTPRALPAPGQASQPRAPGLVLAAFNAALSHLPVLQEAVSSSPLSPSRARHPNRASPSTPRSPAQDPAQDSGRRRRALSGSPQPPLPSPSHRGRAPPRRHAAAPRAPLAPRSHPRSPCLRAGQQRRAAHGLRDAAHGAAA